MFYHFLISTFILAAVIQLCYLLLLTFKAKPDNINEPQPVSIIICAKNEAHNLLRFLPFVLQQDYPAHLFEVIVVNDGSTDDSASVLANLQKEYPQLKVVTITVDTVKHLPGKKYALAEGVKAATHNRLLLTDADCKPASNQWLKEMTATDADIVLGYGAYEAKPGLLNKFIRWETVNTCMQYAGYAARELTYMGVGRNLSYKKDLLAAIENDEPFQKIYRNTPSGDDDLLIGKMATNKKVVIYLRPEAHTISRPQETWSAWWKQKTRHVSTGKYYPAKIKNLLGLYGLSHSLYWFCGIILIAQILADCQLPTANYAVLILFILRLALYWVNSATWYRRLAEKKLLLFYPLGDLGWALYNVILSPYIFWKNRQAWK